MRIHEVVIVPGAGYMSAEGIYTRGHQTPRTTELEVVDRYVQAIVDEFEGASIRYRVLPTRTRPGINEGMRHVGILPRSLVLHCRTDFNAQPPSKVVRNRSRTFYGSEAGRPLATVVEEVMSHWGTLYVAHEHMSASPVLDLDDPLLTVSECVGLRLEPYSINGPNADLYFTKLEHLGRDIGRGIADFLISADLSARMKPCTLAGNKIKS